MKTDIQAIPKNNTHKSDKQRKDNNKDSKDKQAQRTMKTVQHHK